MLESYGFFIKGVCMIDFWRASSLSLYNVTRQQEYERYSVECISERMLAKATNLLKLEQVATSRFDGIVTKQILLANVIGIIIFSFTGRLTTAGTHNPVWYRRSP